MSEPPSKPTRRTLTHLISDPCPTLMSARSRSRSDISATQRQQVGGCVVNIFIRMSKLVSPWGLLTIVVHVMGIMACLNEFFETEGNIPACSFVFRTSIALYIPTQERSILICRVPSCICTHIRTDNIHINKSTCMRCRGAQVSESIIVTCHHPQRQPHRLLIL